MRILRVLYVYLFVVGCDMHVWECVLCMRVRAVVSSSFVCPFSHLCSYCVVALIGCSSVVFSEGSLDCLYDITNPQGY